MSVRPLAAARLLCPLLLPVLAAPDLVDLVAAHAERVDMRVILRWQNERLLSLIRDLPDVLAAARERRLGVEHKAALRQALIDDCDRRMARQEAITLSEYGDFQLRYDLGVVAVLQQEAARQLASWRTALAEGRLLPPREVAESALPLMRQWQVVAERLSVLPLSQDDARGDLRAFVRSLLALSDGNFADGLRDLLRLGAEDVDGVSDAPVRTMVHSPMQWRCVDREFINYACQKKENY